MITADEILNIEKLREDFPILDSTVNGRPLVYFDNAATTQKPLSVIRAIEDYYTKLNSNVHRGVHTLSQKATDAFEEARRKTAEFIHARSENEIIFTRGTTESINLLASSFGKQFIGRGDEIIISAMEHHSNIVPWQMIGEEREAALKVIPINREGELQMDVFANMLNEKVKIIALTYISNALGTVNPVKEIIELAHAKNIPVMIDAAQAVQHIPIDVQDLDCDFLAFSGHKMYGPTGIGVLYGKESWLNQLPPYQGGGEMIKTVSFEKTIYNDIPFKFEAGTPNIEAAICLGTAIDYLNEIGLDKIHQYESELLKYATKKLAAIEGIRFFGTAKNRSSVISFLVKELHPFDIGTLLDKQGVAVRTGHHCTEPLMDFFAIPGTVRASFAFYNTKKEIDIFVEALKKAISMLE